MNHECRYAETVTSRNIKIVSLLVDFSINSSSKSEGLISTTWYTRNLYRFMIKMQSQWFYKHISPCFRFLFCRRDWEIAEISTLESLEDQSIARGHNQNTLTGVYVFLRQKTCISCVALSCFHVDIFWKAISSLRISAVTPYVWPECSFRLESLESRIDKGSACHWQEMCCDGASHETVSGLNPFRSWGTRFVGGLKTTHEEDSPTRFQGLKGACGGAGATRARK